MTAAPTSGPAKRWWVPLVAAVVIALAWLQPLDRLAEEQMQAGLGRALTTFAVARTLNGIISVAQETGVSVQPAGVGMTFAPGQLLDPLNDLIEQVSTVMLAVSVSFGIQLMLLHIGGSAWVSAGLTAGVLAFAALAWTGRAAPPWASRLLLAMILVRFAVPLAATVSELCYDMVMADRYGTAHEVLSKAGVSGTAAPSGGEAASGAKPSTPTPGVREWFSSIFERQPAAPAGQEAKIERIEAIKQRLEGAVRHLLELVAIFVLQTVLLPLLFIFFLGKLVSGILVR